MVDTDLDTTSSGAVTKAWTKILGTSEWDEAYAVKTGNDGSIYIAGFTDGNLDGQSNSGYSDAFLTKYDSDGNKNWTQLLGTEGRYKQGINRAMTIGGDGSIYIAGDTSGELDGQEKLNPGWHAYVSKYDPDGTYKWAQFIGTTSENKAYAITTGKDGSIYIAGHTQGDLDGKTNSGNLDAFLTKYDADGNKDWTQLLGTSGHESASALTTGNDGSIYIAGYTEGDLDGQSNSGKMDVFLAKYDSYGNKDWTQQFGSSEHDHADALTTGSDGSIYIAGITGGDLGGQENIGLHDVFLRKYDTDGNQTWAQLFGTTSYEWVNALTTGSDGSIYMSGTTEGELNGQPNSGYIDAFLSKYDPDGTTDWTKLLGTASADYAHAVTTGNDGSIYIAGNTSGNLDGETNSGKTDAFLTKFIDHDVTQSDSDGNVLELGYSLKGNDNTGNPGGDAQALGVDDSGLTNVAVLGPNTSENKTYTLEITAESLKNGWDLESADIVLKYDTKLFEEIDFDDIQIGGDLPISNAVDIDDENGLIRIAAASLGSLGTGDSIDDEALFASIKVDFDESYFKDADRTPDANGKFTFAGNPLGFELSANSDETVFSRTFDSDIDGNEIAGGGFANREIKSLGDLKGNTTFDEGDVNLYQAEIKFSEQDGGLTFGTKRVIGANQGFTNLIRKGDTVTAETTVENIGNSLAKNVTISDAGKVSNAQFVASRFLDSNGNELISDAQSPINLSGGVFNDDFSYDATKQESVDLAVDMKVTGAAGTVIDVTKGLFQVSAEGMNQNPDTTPDIFVSGSGSKNLITFQGDLNYDGRVSMKDLAYLNAGAARQQTTTENTTGEDLDSNGVVDASVAHDVDADFNGKIDLVDLAILDADWGETLHTGTETFTGSGDLTWDNLDSQGTNATWDNDAFKDQNEIEASSDYIGSLESPTATGVIGADGDSDANDGDMQGTEFQDPLPI